MIRIVSEKDPWSQQVEQLNCMGLTKQLALNSIVLAQSEQQIQLGLRSDQSNLNHERYIDNLQSELRNYLQSSITVSVIFSDDTTQLTPIELRRQVYEALTKEAQLALQQDQHLQYLQDVFDGQLDLSSVRPVANE